MPDPIVAPDTEVEDQLSAEELAAEAAADAEFAEGFTGAPTEKTPPADSEEKPADDKPVEGTPPAEVEPPPEYIQVTKKEWGELTAKAAEIDQIRTDTRKELDRAFGKVGGLERKFSEMQAATPNGMAVEVTDDTVAELKEQFPELADLTLKAFKTFATKLKGTGQALDPAALNKAVTDQVVAREIESLDDEHTDWREITKEGPETPYRKWLATQPAEYQARLNSTNSAAVISRSITKFQAAEAVALRASEEAATKKAAAEAKAKADAEIKSKRLGRMAGAVPPKGEGGHPPEPSADDEFNAGFKSG